MVLRTSRIPLAINCGLQPTFLGLDARARRISRWGCARVASTPRLSTARGRAEAKGLPGACRAITGWWTWDSEKLECQNPPKGSWLWWCELRWYLMIWMVWMIWICVGVSNAAISSSCYTTWNEGKEVWQTNHEPYCLWVAGIMIWFTTSLKLLELCFVAETKNLDRHHSRQQKNEKKVWITRDISPYKCWVNSRKLGFPVFKV